MAPDRVPGVISSVKSGWFDLSADVPLRGSLVQSGDEEFLLVLVIHHIAGDGASLAPLARDVSVAYRARVAGREPEWTELPVQYADYTLWQREELGDLADPESLLSVQAAYWREELAGVSKPLPLPLDRPRPEAASHRGGSVEIGLSTETRTRIEAMARAHGATVSMVFQAALTVLLHRMGSGDDVTVGSPVAGRTDEALSDLVRFFVNSWVLWVRLSAESSFERVLEQVRQKALAAYENQDVPFERLLELLRPERSAAHHPLFQVVRSTPPISSTARRWNRLRRGSCAWWSRSSPTPRSGLAEHSLRPAHRQRAILHPRRGHGAVSPHRRRTARPPRALARRVAQGRVSGRAHEGSRGRTALSRVGWGRLDWARMRTTRGWSAAPGSRFRAQRTARG
ncbi:condensation domain-containing protein [Streptomyces sp. NPDC001340]